MIMKLPWIIAIVIYAAISIYFGLNPTKGGILDRLNNSIKNKKGKVLRDLVDFPQSHQDCVIFLNGIPG